MTRKPQLPATEPALPTIHPHAAGLDIGSEEIWVAVPADRDPNPVQRFGTYTPDLYALADWLQRCRIDTVAMESTGVYWIPIFEILAAREFEVQVVNARHLKQVPGRKSDVQDCQWIQRLHSFGWLTGSFRPEAEMRVLRAYLRHRATLIEYRAAHVPHLQKALQQMSMMAQPSGCAKSATDPSPERHHGRDGNGHCAGDRGGGTQSGDARRLPRRTVC